MPAETPDAADTPDAEGTRALGYIWASSGIGSAAEAWRFRKKWSHLRVCRANRGCCFPPTAVLRSGCPAIILRMVLWLDPRTSQKRWKLSPLLVSPLRPLLVPLNTSTRFILLWASPWFSNENFWLNFTNEILEAKLLYSEFLSGWSCASVASHSVAMNRSKKPGVMRWRVFPGNHKRDQIQIDGN